MVNIHGCVHSGAPTTIVGGAVVKEEEKEASAAVTEESGQGQSDEGEGEGGKRGSGRSPIGGTEQVLPEVAVSAPECLRPGSEKMRSVKVPAG